MSSAMKEMSDLRRREATLIEQEAAHRRFREPAEAAAAALDLERVRFRIDALRPTLAAEIEAADREEQRLRDAAAARQAAADRARAASIADLVAGLVPAAEALDLAMQEIEQKAAVVLDLLAALDARDALNALAARGYRFDVGGPLLSAMLATAPRVAGLAIGAARAVERWAPEEAQSMAATAGRVADAAKRSAAPTLPPARQHVDPLAALDDPAVRRVVLAAEHRRSAA